MGDYKHMKKGPKHLKSETVVRKRMHKKGKNWITLATTFTLLLGMGVQVSTPIVLAAENDSTQANLEKMNQFVQNVQALQEKNQEASPEQTAVPEVQKNGKLNDVAWNLDENEILHFNEGTLLKLTEDQENPFLSFVEEVKVISFDKPISIQMNSLMILQKLVHVESIKGLENVTLQPTGEAFIDFTKGMEQLEKREEVMNVFNPQVKSETVEKDNVEGEIEVAKGTEIPNQVEKGNLPNANKADDERNQDATDADKDKEESHFSLRRMPFVAPAIASMGSTGETEKVPVGKEEEIKIGALLGLTGDRLDYNSNEQEEIYAQFEIDGMAEKDENNHSFVLGKDSIQTATGFIILNNDMDLSNSFSMEGTFGFKHEWLQEGGKDERNLFGSDGAGFIITNNPFDKIIKGRAGGTLGVYNLNHTIFAGLDLYNNDSGDTDAGTKVLEDDYSEGMVTQTSNGETQKNFGGILTEGRFKSTSSVLKFLSNFDESTEPGTDTSKSIVGTPNAKDDEIVAIPYLPGNNNKIANSDKKEHYVVSWTPISNQTLNGNIYVTGTLTVSFTGADPNNEKEYGSPTRTIKKTFTLDARSALGFISSNGAKKDTVTDEVTKLSYTKSATNIQIKYLSSDNKEIGEDSVVEMVPGDTFSFNEAKENANYVLNLPDNLGNYTINYKNKEVDGKQTADGKTMTYTVISDKTAEDFKNDIPRKLTFRFEFENGKAPIEFNYEQKKGEAFVLKDHSEVFDLYMKYAGQIKNTRPEEEYKYESEDDKDVLVTFFVEMTKPTLSYRDFDTKKYVEVIADDKEWQEIPKKSDGSLDIEKNQNVMKLIDFYSQYNLTGNHSKIVYKDNPLQLSDLSTSNDKFQVDWENMQLKPNEVNSTIFVQEVQAKGVWGTAHWYLDLDGTLHIGPGSLKHFNEGESPFVENENINKNIKKVSIEGAIVAPEDSSGLFNFGQKQPLEAIIGLDKVDTSKTKDMQGIIYGKNLKTLIGYENWNVDQVENYQFLFYLPLVTSLNFNNWRLKDNGISNNMIALNGVNNLKQITFGPDFKAQVKLPTKSGFSWRRVDEKNGGTIDNPQGKVSLDGNTYTGLSADADTYVLVSDTYVPPVVDKFINVNYQYNSNLIFKDSVKLEKQNNSTDYTLLDMYAPEQGAYLNKENSMDSKPNNQESKFSFYVYKNDPFQEKELKNLNVTISQDLNIDLIPVRAKGTLGTVKWYIDMNGELHISGGEFPEIKGTWQEMKNGSFPWTEFVSDIKKIFVEGKVDAKTSISGIFKKLSQVTEINGLGNIDVSNVVSFSQAFWNMNSVIELNLRGWDTSSAVDMGNMFTHDYSLVEIKGLNEFDTSKVESFYDMFMNTSSLQVLDMSSWDTSKVTSIGEMLGGQLNSLWKIIIGKGFNLKVDFPKTNMTDTLKWRNVAEGTEVEPQGENWFSQYSGDPEDADTYVLGPKPIPFENIIPQTGSKQSAFLYGFSGFALIGLALFETLRRKKETDEDLKEMDDLFKK